MSSASEPSVASPPVVLDAPAPVEPVSRRPRRWLVPVVLALTIVALAAVWLSLYNAQRAFRVEVAQRLTELDATGATARATLKDAQQELRDAQAKIALLENRVAESQTQQAALEALYRELAPSRDEWALTEIEQVLLLASQQLQFAGNVQSALAALQLADAKLQRLDRPQFTPLRRALARDIERLKAVPFVDVPGVSLKLDQAIGNVSALPLAMEERVPPPPHDSASDEASAWRRFWREVWQDVRQLVLIENLHRPEAPLLTPPQQFFLRENLKLRLLSARFDILFRDQANFHADVSAASEWLRKYFDVRSKPVQSMEALLKELEATEMSAEVPDLGRSLEAVRILRLAHDKSAR